MKTALKKRLGRKKSSFSFADGFTFGRKGSQSASTFSEVQVESDTEQVEEEKEISEGAVVENMEEEDVATVHGILIRLDRAEDLPSGDSNGLSDPYVVFRSAKSKHKSTVVKKTLNPSWQEEFFLQAEDVEGVLKVEVMDKDTLSSDFLCSAEVDISELTEEDDKWTEFSINLFRGKKKRTSKRGGTLFFSAKRIVTTPAKAKQKARTWKPSKFAKRQVIVELIQGLDLLPMDLNGKSDPFVTLRIGKIKHKSRVMSSTLDPKWRQRFEFLLDDKSPTLPPLTVKVFDRDMLSKNDAMGGFQVDLADLATNLVHDAWYNVDKDGKSAGHVQLQITVIDQDAAVHLSKEMQKLVSASLKVHIIRARNLKVKDTMAGTSDPYVEVQVGKYRSRTPVVPKSLNPEFDCVLEVPVTDIYSIVKVSLWDYDHGSKPDLLGWFVVPLLEIQNKSTVTYALKNKDMTRTTKGEVRIAFNLSFSSPLAYLDFTKPVESNFMAKPKPFSTRRLKNAIERLNSLALPLIGAATYAVDLLLWKRGPLRSILAAFCWTVFCLFFRLWHLPLILSLGMVYTRLTRKPRMPEFDRSGLLITKASKQKKKLIKELSIDEADEPEPEEDDLEEDEGNGEKAESKAGMLKQAGQLRKIGQQVQTQLEQLADTGERLKNVFNWTVPVLTQFAVLGLFLVAAVLSMIPWNVLLMLGGNGAFAATAAAKYIIKKTKWDEQHLAPNEIVSRVPSDVEKAMRNPVVLDATSKRHSKRRLFSRLRL